MLFVLLILLRLLHVKPSCVAILQTLTPPFRLFSKFSTAKMFARVLVALQTLVVAVLAQEGAKVEVRRYVLEAETQSNRVVTCALNAVPALCTGGRSGTVQHVSGRHHLPVHHSAYRRHRGLHLLREPESGSQGAQGKGSSFRRLFLLLISLALPWLRSRRSTRPRRRRRTSARQRDNTKTLERERRLRQSVRVFCCCGLHWHPPRLSFASSVLENGN